MLGGACRELFAVIAECAATLSGLSFVAVTVVGRQRPADRPVVVGQVRAAASVVASTNALTVSLLSLVPGKMPATRCTAASMRQPSGNSGHEPHRPRRRPPNRTFCTRRRLPPNCTVQCLFGRLRVRSQVSLREGDCA
jgi:hypothetical protein